MSLINANDTWALWTVVFGCVGICIWLEQTYKWAAKISAVVLALAMGLLLANLRIIPTDAPVYDSVWGYLVPLALPLLLLKTDLKKIWKESRRMLLAFLIGSAGTVTGAVVAYQLLANYIPELKGIAGMMTGTYIGGSVNFVAMSVAFDVSKDMVSAATVADNLNMAIYFVVLLGLGASSLMRRLYPHPLIDEGEKQGVSEEGKTTAAEYWGKKEISLKDLALCVAIAFAIVTASKYIAGWCELLIPGGNVVLDMLQSMLGNQYLWITTVTVALATWKPDFFGSIPCSQEIGTYLIYCFMFVIGAPASLLLILKNSPLLLVFSIIIIVFNMLFVFVGGKFCGLDLETLIIASNANIGGPTTAAGMAIAKGWTELVGPALLMGSFGYVIGNYLGLFIGQIL